jgi:GNAT superfamily N-acetyltransferase
VNVTAEAPIEQATIADLIAVSEEREWFWGERDKRFLHHVMLVREFGDTAFVVRDSEGKAIAYLFGLVTPAHVGYVHLVAVREGHRGQGLAKRLYARFEEVARELGALRLKAITQPVNAVSIAFHRAQGFAVTEVEGYSGPGTTRIVFSKDIGGAGAG